MEIKKTVFIELSGTPYSGKTILSNMLKDKTERLNAHRYVKIRGMDSKKIEIPKTSFRYDIWQGCQIIKDIHEAQYSNSESLWILDRGIFDQLCWLEYFKDEDKIDDYTYECIENFMKMPINYSDIQYNIVLMTSNYEISNKRSDLKSSVKKRNKHEKLESIYKRKFENFVVGEDCNKKMKIVTDNRTADEVFDMVWFDLMGR